jgi:hypothetical protein
MITPLARWKVKVNTTLRELSRELVINGLPLVVVVELQFKRSPSLFGKKAYTHICCTSIATTTTTK